MTKPLVVSMGDPAGVGLDVTLKAWQISREENLPAFVFLGNPNVLQDRATELQFDVPIENISSLDNAHEIFGNALPVLPQPCSALVKAGKPDKAHAPAIIQSINAGVRYVHQGEAKALVTNPINKALLYSDGFEFPGHTEFLAALAEDYWGGDKLHPVMMLACEELRAVPLTIHIPLNKVPQQISKSLIVRTGDILWNSLKTNFQIKRPHIAVCGLNPHAGENGNLGQEDKTIIEPAIKELQQRGMNFSGPHPADTLFHPEARNSYDAVLAMYHDQALIPVKTIAFDSAVNVTLGLPFIRTSPDHGTAYDIAGTGKANPKSFVAALRMAGELGTKASSTVRKQTLATGR